MFSSGSPASDAASALAVGEILWDALPAGLFLGGAPFNVACHLHQLGEAVTFASRVGDDELGREARRRIRHHGMSDSLVQGDAVLPTGFVRVSLDPSGNPTFEILAPAAWDAIDLSEDLLAAARRCRVLVCGTLAQRAPQSRATIQRLMHEAPFAALDVNLRPPFDDRTVVEASLRAAHLVKLSQGELAALAGWFDMPAEGRRAAESLAARFDLTTVCVTSGERGAALLHGGQWHSVPGIPVEVVDAVGAGDAFFAALLAGMLRGLPPVETLAWANAVGAFVASRAGATPPIDPQSVQALLISSGASHLASPRGQE